MRAFKCDNCEDLVAGPPRHSVVAKVGRENVLYRITVSYCHQSKEPELCKNCLLVVLDNALMAYRAGLEKED